MDAVKTEATDEVKISTLTALAASGYESVEISDRALDIFKSTEDSLVRRQASKLLGFLKDERLLSELVIIAKGNNPSLSTGALLAIAGYGEGANEIKPHLLEIINNSDLNTEVINLAQVTYDSIEADEKPRPSIRAITTRSLWPVNLPEDRTESEPVVEVGAFAEVIEEVTTPEPAIEEEPAEVVVTEAVEEDVEQSSNWLLWLIGAVVVVGGVFAVRSRK